MFVNLTNILQQKETVQTGFLTFRCVLAVIEEREVPCFFRASLRSLVLFAFSRHMTVAKRFSQEKL